MSGTSAVGGILMNYSSLIWNMGTYKYRPNRHGFIAFVWRVECMGAVVSWVVNIELWIGYKRYWIAKFVYLIQVDSRYDRDSCCIYNFKATVFTRHLSLFSFIYNTMSMGTHLRYCKRASHWHGTFLKPPKQCHIGQLHCHSKNVPPVASLHKHRLQFKSQIHHSVRIILIQM
jgi:hypothetical protein